MTFFKNIPNPVILGNGQTDDETQRIQILWFRQHFLVYTNCIEINVANPQEFYSKIMNISPFLHRDIWPFLSVDAIALFLIIKFPSFIRNTNLLISHFSRIKQLILT